MDALGIMVRWALFADLMLLFGVPLFAIYSDPAALGEGALPVRRAVIVTAALGLALSGVGIAQLAASMSGVPLAGIELPAISVLVTATAAGTAFLVRSAALLAALSIGARRHAGRAAWMAVALCGAAALASLAWAGHAVMDSGAIGTIHLAADIVHLLGAGAWVGALASLLWLLLNKLDHGAAVSHRALAGFASVGSASVALVLISGLINSWLLVGPQNLWSIGTSLYGRLLLIKLALFAFMLALATINRFRLTPALGTAMTPAGVATAARRLRLSLTLETFAAFAILGFVAWLGTLEPPISTM